MEYLHWHKKAAGVWSTKIGQIDSFTPLSIVDKMMRKEPLESMADCAFPINEDHIIVDKNSNKIIIRLPLTSDEKIYS